MLPLLSELVSKARSLFSFEDYGLLWLRLWVAQIFYASGRAKAGGSFWEVGDLQVTLFEDEYGITFLDPAFMAQMALYMETILPVLLILGFLSRFAALGLLGMTAFIQIFVYPAQFPEHFLWAATFLAIIMLGAGRISVDHLAMRVRS